MSQWHGMSIWQNRPRLGDLGGAGEKEAFICHFQDLREVINFTFLVSYIKLGGSIWLLFWFLSLSVSDLSFLRWANWSLERQNDVKCRLGRLFQDHRLEKRNRRWLFFCFPRAYSFSPLRLDTSNAHLQLSRKCQKSGIVSTDCQNLFLVKWTSFSKGLLCLAQPQWLGDPLGVFCIFPVLSQSLVPFGRGTGKDRTHSPCLLGA